MCAVTAAALLMVDDICAVTSATAVAPVWGRGGDERGIGCV